MGSGKESLIFMKKRTKRFTAQWALAAQRLAQKLGGVRRDQKQVPHPPSVFKELSLVSPGPQAAKGTLGLPLKDFYCVYLNLSWGGAAAECMRSVHKAWG